ncbi:MAG TPA: outer membrane lipoprotein chaperone LolA [Vicinamibacteria bacterium]|nr:outer membrane lipoprotein chaperone LolA [Vicinamibacteria bacterium]
MALGLTGSLLAMAGTATPTSPGAEALARRVDARQKGVRDLTARFVQSYRSGILGREVVERGTLAIKKPGRMRWEYKEPEKKLFVSDGKQFFFYVPADRQVIVKEQAGEQGIPAFLLAGQGILDQFQVFPEPPLPGRERLRLVPRKADPEVERIYLDVDAEARVRAIEVWDAQGGHSRFQFEDVKENVGLPDAQFRFEVPRGVEVVAG